MAIVELPKGRYVNKPPNSFSSGDILRIIANNTTRQEKLHIHRLLDAVEVVVVPVVGFLTDIIDAISSVFKPSDFIFKILKFLRLFDNIVQRLNPIDASLLIMLLPEEPRKEATHLLKVLKRGFSVD